MLPSSALQVAKPVWPQYDFDVKKNYYEALSRVVTNFNISACSDPFTSNEPCEITYSEILCQAVDSSCFSSANPSENDFVECLTAVLAPMDEPPAELPCQVAVDAFNDNYGTSFTPLELAVLLGGFDDDLCGDQEMFDEWVCNLLGCNYCSSANTLFDYIKKDESLINCSKVNCIYDLLADRMNQLFCQTIGNYMGSSIFDIEIKIGNTTGDGVTNYREDEDLVVITLDANFCNENSSELAIMSTILHEGIHAEIMRLLLDKGLNPNEVNNYETVWDNYIVDFYAENSGSVNDIQHAVMVRVEDYVSQIATALWSMNNEQLSVDHYKHYAWNGLRRYSIEFADDLYGLESPFFELYQELLETNPSFGCN